MATAPCTCKPDDGSGRCPREQECYENWLASRLESGPQSEAQWLGDVADDMSDEEVSAWAEVL